MKLPWLSSSQRRFFKLVLNSLRKDPGQWVENGPGGWFKNATLDVSVWSGRDNLKQSEIKHKKRTIFAEADNWLQVEFQPWRRILARAKDDALACQRLVPIYDRLISAVGHPEGDLLHKTPSRLDQRVGEMLVRSIESSPGDWIYDGDCHLTNPYIGVKVWVHALKPSFIHVEFGTPERRLIDDVILSKMVPPKWRRDLIKTLKAKIASNEVRMMTQIGAWEEYRKLKTVAEKMRKEMA